MTRAASIELDSGDVCFGLTLKHLHRDRGIDVQAVTRDGVAFVTALEGQRDVIASPAPLSRSMLSALGHAINEPPVHGTPAPVLHGGFAVLRAERGVDTATLLLAYRNLSCGEPIPSLAPEGLDVLEIFEAASALDHDAAGSAVIDEAVPGRAEIVSAAVDALSRELVEARAMIRREFAPQSGPVQA